MSPEVEALVKKRYWDLYAQERIPHTPEITKELDHIERVIECETVMRAIPNWNLPAAALVPQLKDSSDPS